MINYCLNTQPNVLDSSLTFDTLSNYATFQNDIGFINVLCKLICDVRYLIFCMLSFICNVS